jgi:peptidoglycan/LPS O-acetylase OafA/YrhL
MLANFILAILFPQALSMSLECSKGWENIFASRDSLTPVSENYQKMASFSGFELNQLGDFDSCNQIAIASYTLLVHSHYPKIIQSFCGPIECTEEDYYNSSLPIVHQRPLQVEFPYKYQKEHYTEYTRGAIAVIITFLLIIGTAVIGTIAECFCAADENKKLLIKILLCFSLIRNSKMLLKHKTQEKEGQKDALDMLNAVRVISFTLVLYAHVVHNKGLLSINSNFQNYINEILSFKFLPYASSLYAVDNFFWVSGFLFGYLFIAEFRKEKKGFISSFIQVFIYRTLRLLPTYVFTLLFFIHLSKYLGSGPLFYKISEVPPLLSCDEYQYTHMLFLNNFIPDYKGNYCFVHGWSLATDMQLFVVSTMILLLYLKTSKTVGWVLIATMCGVSVISSAIIVHEKNFTANGIAIFTDDFFFNYYIKPYTRAKPYALGLAAALVMHSYRQLKNHNEIYDSFANAIAEKINMIYKKTMVLGIVLIIALFYCEFVNNMQFLEIGEIDEYRKAVKQIYMIASGLVYSFAITCILLPLLLGNVPMVISFMSHSIWSFLAKISFAMYVLHLGLIYIEGRSTKIVEEFGFYQSIRGLIYMFILCVTSAIPLTLFVEFPSQNLIGFLAKTKRTSSNNAAQSKKID